MRAETITGYSRSELDVENEEYPHEYPFVLIKLMAEPTNGGENRVASYIEYNGMADRASRLFVERSPPGMEWLEKVFKLIKETESRGIISGGLHEVSICEDRVEVLEERHTLIDHERGKAYYDDDGAGTSIELEEYRDRNID